MAEVIKERQEIDNGDNYPPVSPLRVIGHLVSVNPQEASLMGGNAALRQRRLGRALFPSEFTALPLCPASPSRLAKAEE